MLTGKRCIHREKNKRNMKGEKKERRDEVERRRARNWSRKCVRDKV